jgi:peroxiredoxin
MSSVDDLTAAAEQEWLEKWTTGPTRGLGVLAAPGTAAPPTQLPDHTGNLVDLTKVWSQGPVLLMFWRHFGCTCGVERARRLAGELDDYEAAGLTPIIISQGEPERAAAYRATYDIDTPILCDPDHAAFTAFGVGQWSVEQVLFDAPREYWKHPRKLGVEFQDGRRDQGRPPVDDPWLAAAEFVVGSDGIIRLSYAYQYCEDFPDPRVLTTAAHLSRDKA